MTDIYETGTAVRVRPDDLLVDVNIRTDAELDPEFVASVQEMGVLQPIVAVLTAEGDLRVRMGKRRTLAAREAGQETVPVYIAAEEGVKKADQIERVIAQRDENDRRKGLSKADDVAAIAQLAAFGLSPAQISKKARVPRKKVDASLAVDGSPLARAAHAKYSSVTLDQAVVLAEFEDDPDTVKELVVAAEQQPGRFDHIAGRARRDREQIAEYKAEVAKFTEETGVAVVEEDHDTAYPLDELVDAETGAPLTTQGHAKCPGHAAWLEHRHYRADEAGNEVHYNDIAKVEWEWVEGWLPQYACDNPRDNGHTTLRMYEEDQAYKESVAEDAANGDVATEEELAQDRERRETEARRRAEEAEEAARAKRRLVIANNKAWDAATQVRRDAVRIYLARKTPPKGTGAFLTRALTRDSHYLNSAHGAGAQIAAWTGITESSDWRHSPIAEVAAEASESRAIVLALAHVLACYEVSSNRDSWRGRGSESLTGRYLAFLRDAFDYTLSEVEEFALSDEVA